MCLRFLAQHLGSDQSLRAGEGENERLCDFRPRTAPSRGASAPLWVAPQCVCVVLCACCLLTLQ